MNMRKTVPGFLVVLFAASAAVAEQPDRWLHVRVVSTGDKGETVRVNVPVEMAEKVLPAIHSDQLRDGKVKVTGKVNDVDLQELFDAIRTAPDNEFVTVEQPHETVRIAKEKGYLLVKVREGKGEAKDSGQAVDIKIPLPVVAALLSGPKDELDVLAALRALKPYGDVELVTVKDRNETVRIWIDTRNTAE